MTGNTIADQLAKLGLVDKERAERAKSEALERERAEQAAKIGTAPRQQAKAALKDPTLDDLRRCGSIRDFCEITKRLLNLDPGHIGEVIQLAHRYQGDKSGKQLIWRTYKVRDLLKHCPPDKRELMLDRAFRKHNPKVEIPE